MAERFDAAGLRPSTWGNAPGDTYGRHSQGYHRVLYCMSWSIVLHLRDWNVELCTGDRLDVPRGTKHAATVGPDGVECMEASR